MTDSIETIAAQPRKAAGDGTSVEMNKIGDLIDADKYVTAKKTTRSGKFPYLARSVARPPGTI